MKLIEAMKEIKRLHVKLGDLKTKVQTYCADMDFENPTYPDQKGQITEWIQSYEDTVKRILDLQLAIQRTNLATEVTIELGGKQVTKTIAAWIHRRRSLATVQQAIWTALGNRGLKDGVMTMTNGEKKDTKVRLYFDPRMKDTKVAELRDEPSLIDATLEVKNAVTDLIEA